jgi:hypothetical protein
MMNYDLALKIIASLSHHECVITGSLATHFWIRCALNYVDNPATREKLESYLAAIHPDDLDVVVTSNRKNDNENCTPQTVGDGFNRVQTDFHAACSYVKGDVKLDLIYEPGTVRFLEIGEGMNFIHPAKLVSQYRDAVDDGGEKLEKNQMKLEALELVTAILSDADLEFTTSDKETRGITKSRFDRSTFRPVALRY